MADENVSTSGGDAGVSGAVPSSAGASIPSGDNPSPVGSSGGAWFSYKDEKGIEKSWKSREDFEKDFKNIGMMRSDYSRQTQKLKAEREEWERNRAEQEKEFQRTKSQYDRYNDFFKSRPDVYRQIEQMVRGGASPEVAIERANSYADEKYGKLSKELEELRNWRQSREREEQKTKLYSEMASRYEDFDKDAVEEALNVLQNGDSESIVELLYHANRGRSMNPVEMQARLAEKAEAKAAGRMIPAGGTSSVPPSNFGSVKEARAAALKNAKS